MKLWVLIIIILLIIFISGCKKTENNISISNNSSNETSIVGIIENDQIISETTDLQNIIFSEFNPSYILLNYNVFQQPNIQSLRARAFYLLDLIEFLGYGEKEIINEENKQWIQIRINNQIGWCFDTDVKKLKQPIEYNPMNVIDVEYLILQNINKNNRFKIGGESGHYSGKYGINDISISFNGRNDYNEEYYFYFYGPESFRKMELCIENDIDVFPSIYWGTHQRKNIINGITVVDTFMFSAHESYNQSIWRVIYFTTNNYDITIRMCIPDSSYENDLIKQIMRESPQYFLLGDHITPYNAEDRREKIVAWDFSNNAIERFGNDLREGINPSQTLNLWYSETNKILESLRIE